jgi:TonB-dependent starch-binding outer membrane protein SusC
MYTRQKYPGFSPGNWLGRLLVVGGFLLGAMPAMAQEITVSGKVTDADTGEPLPGATIQVKGTSRGTSTDFEGNYSISMNANGTLIITYIGFTRQEVVVGTRRTIDIALVPDLSSLSEVVVIGYGSIDKKDVTGVVTQIGERDFNKGVISSPDKLLNGKVAGLQITDNGEPGGGVGIRLRGVSFNGETPLFVVDGIPLEPGGVTGGRNPLNFINPADVLDITVLKDASAAAIYGSRGANGVIIITTKSGQAGKPQVTYDAFYSLSVPVRQIDVLSPELFRAAIALKAPQELPNLGTANTNWINEVTQPASSMQHNLSLSGGKNKTTYHGSVSYLQNDGVLRYTQNKNLNLGLKLNQKLLNDRLNVRFSTRTGFTKDLFGPNVIGAAASFDPTRPIRSGAPEFEQFGGYFQWEDPLAVNNPVASQEQLNQRGETFRSLNNLEFEYKLPWVEGLRWVSNIGYDFNDGTYRGLAPANSKEGFIREGNFMEQFNTRHSWVFEHYANYKKQMGDHGLDLTAGYSYQDSRSEFDQLSGNGLDDENNPTENIEPFNRIDENRLISFFARANYDLKGKYLFSASMRYDGSSRFGPANRWGLFPAVSAAWRVLDEDFAKSWNSLFTDLKIRASYGVTGNQEIGNYLYSTFYRYSEPNASYQFGDEYVLTLRPRGVDPNIKWEETVSANIGVDFGLIRGRLSGSIDVYDKQVNDLLFTIAVPAGSNLSDRVLTNIGRVSNRGVELVLNGVVIDKTDFNWDLSFNASYNKNKILKLDNLQGEALNDFPGYETGGISGDIGQTIQVLRVGYPINVFRTYVHKRNPDGSLVVDPNNDGIQSLLEMYEDINGDGIINENDKVPGKQPFPAWIMGLTSNMSYKKWDLSFTLRASLGNYVYNNTSSANGYFEKLTDRTTQNIHTSAFETNFKERQLHSDFYVENASFLKLDNITLGYNFGKVKFTDNLRLYTTVQNAMTLTGYSGVEPELFNGIDNNLYPRSTTFIVGFNAKF